MKTDEALMCAMRQHTEDAKTIAQLQAEILRLRTENYAREAIDIFCPPEFRVSAMSWLRDRNL